MTAESARVILYALAASLDLAALVFGFVLATLVRGGEWLAPSGYPVVLIAVPIFATFAFAREAYSVDTLEHLADAIRRPLSALGGTALTLMMLSFLAQAGEDVSRAAFLAAMGASATLIVVARLLLHAVVRVWLKGKVTSSLLIVDGVEAEPEPGMHVVNVERQQLRPDLANPHVLAQLSQLVAPYDRVVVACPEERGRAWAMFLKGSDTGGEIMVPPSVTHGAVAIGQCGNQDTFVLSRGPLSFASRMRKRAFDLAVTIPLLIFLAPLMFFVALAIKLETTGPVFFRQTRIGQGNRHFRVYKFRSMRVDGCDALGTQSTLKDDERITRVGRFIRRTSIDELPQLLNVLVGDMSVVGPRPHALGSLAGDQLFWEVTERYWLRHALKPGITGLAQIRGYRGATHQREDLEARLRHDLEYLQTWSVWRDVTILFATLKVVVHPNAY